jgi:hypothetical protein
MPTFGREHYHRRRAAEERARTKLATTPAAKASHARLAKLHTLFARDPKYIPFAKASRSGQPASYWAAANLSNKETSDAHDIVEAREPKQVSGAARLSPEALNRRSGPALMKLLNQTFPAADGDLNFPLAGLEDSSPE